MVKAQLFCLCHHTQTYAIKFVLSHIVCFFCKSCFSFVYLPWSYDNSIVFSLSLSQRPELEKATTQLSSHFHFYNKNVQYLFLLYKKCIISWNSISIQEPQSLMHMVVHQPPPPCPKTTGPGKKQQLNCLLTFTFTTTGVMGFLVIAALLILVTFPVIAALPVIVMDSKMVLERHHVVSSPGEEPHSRQSV